MCLQEDPFTSHIASQGDIQFSFLPVAEISRTLCLQIQEFPEKWLWFVRKYFSGFSPESNITIECGLDREGFGRLKDQLKRKITVFIPSFFTSDHCACRLSGKVHQWKPSYLDYSLVPAGALSCGSLCSSISASLIPLVCCSSETLQNLWCSHSMSFPIVALS